MRKIMLAIIISVSLAIISTAQLSGPLSGILPGNHTYTVIGDISVAAGDSLIIESGAILIFSDCIQFDVYGYLYAVGMETDSIKFINSPGSTWDGLIFNSSASDSSIIEYCQISGGYNFSGGGIYCYEASPMIYNCTISGNTAYWGGGGGGINCTYSSPIISSCTISGNKATYGGGIFCYFANPIVSNCAISGNNAISYGGGIYCEASSPFISNCVINSDTSTFGGGISIRFSPIITITNCTISRNNAWEGNQGGGIYCETSIGPNILNTIIENNLGNYGVYLYNCSNPTINHSDFYNNQNGNLFRPPQGVGQITTTNINGDSCDVYHNIFLDPLFISPTQGDFHLTANSPCIDAGDPASPSDPDSTIADIGVYYFDQTPSPITDLRITIQGNDIILQWSPAAGAASYNVYRSEQPYFAGSAGNLIGNTVGTVFGDENALEGENYFYRITYRTSP